VSSLSLLSLSFFRDWLQSQGKTKGPSERLV
jgi:hypothetical protein